MEEGNWIEMTGTPLIATEGTAAEGEVDANAEGGGAEMGHGADHETEGGTEQGAEAMHDDRAECTRPAEESPANDAERAVGAEHDALAARTSPEATATTAEDVVRALVEQVNETVRALIGGDVDDVAHATEL
jgi:creatinine amidohydrolase/Fe(II)-dependent formamide hydrolase-like protein